MRLVISFLSQAMIVFRQARQGWSELIAMCKVINLPLSKLIPRKLKTFTGQDGANVLGVLGVLGMELEAHCSHVTCAVTLLVIT